MLANDSVSLSVLLTWFYRQFFGLILVPFLVDFARLVVFGLSASDDEPRKATRILVLLLIVKQPKIPRKKKAPLRRRYLP
jgi:hypothetical protein